MNYHHHHNKISKMMRKSGQKIFLKNEIKSVRVDIKKAYHMVQCTS